MAKMFLHQLLFVFVVIISCLFIQDSHSFADNNKYKPKTYEQAYDLVISKPDEAINIIKHIDNQNIPVKENDILVVKAMAGIALGPKFREIDIGINLLNKVVKIKPKDYGSNAMLFSLYSSKLAYNPEKAKDYAINLLNADYQAHIKLMNSASPEKSSLQVIRNYKEGMIAIYEHIYNLFTESGETNRANKAKDISNDIMKRK